jgi:hypothetical protein
MKDMPIASTEWEFRSFLEKDNGQPLSEKTAAALLDVVLRWVEERGLQVGGGYRRPEQEEAEPLNEDSVPRLEEGELRRSPVVEEEAPDKVRYLASIGVLGSSGGPGEVTRALGLEASFRPESTEAGELEAEVEVLQPKARALRRVFAGSQLEVVLRDALDALSPLREEISSLRGAGAEACLNVAALADCDAEAGIFSAEFTLSSDLLRALADLGLPVVFEV